MSGIDPGEVQNAVRSILSEAGDGAVAGIIGSFIKSAEGKKPADMMAAIAFLIGFVTEPLKEADRRLAVAAIYDMAFDATACCELSGLVWKGARH